MSQGELAEIIDVQWFCGRDNIGIVVMRTSIGEIKTYIGLCSGLCPKEDAQYIAAWGSSVNVQQLMRFLHENADRS